MYSIFLKPLPNMYAGMAVALAMFFGGMFIAFWGLKIQSMVKLYFMLLGVALTFVGYSIFMVCVVNLIC